MPLRRRRPWSMMTFGERNDDSFSSLPSTHASRDPFLNDDVPIEITRLEAREDRPRKGGFEEDLGAAWGKGEISLGRNNMEIGSPPVSLSSSSTLRKRSSLWKRTYDPENESQSHHEGMILKAVALSEAAVKEKSVAAAQQLGKIVEMQVAELDVALGEVEKRVEHARLMAEQLPSTRDTRFEDLLYGNANTGGEVGKAEAERVFLELQWTERVWDVEAMVAEKRFHDCVSAIEKLNEDGIAESALPRTLAKYHSIVQKLVTEMSTCCTQGGGDIASIFAPLLARVGMAEHARKVVLDSAEAELISELQAITGPGNEVMPRTVSLVLDRTLAMFQQTYAVYSRISVGGSQNSSFFVAWVVEQSDKVYTRFVSVILSKLKTGDPVQVFAAIEAARRRKMYPDARFQRNGESLVALLETRATTHIRKELDELIGDAERQLVDRSRIYASAIPRNWREGPYQSGKAICDELNILSRGLEGALMNLDTETDVLSGNLLVRLVLEYCASLLDMGAKAVAEDDSLTTDEMQEGIRETFSMIGKTVLRLHQKYAKIPSLERVANILTSSDLVQVRMLHNEITLKKTPSPNAAAVLPCLVPFAEKSSSSGHTLPANTANTQGSSNEVMSAS